MTLLPAVPDDAAVAVFERVKAELAEATSIDEVKMVLDKAAAARVWAARAGCSRELVQMLAEYRVRAERRLGELLADPVIAPVGRPAKRLQPATISLGDLGVEKTLSHRCQRIASLPQEAFEGYIARATESGRDITTSDVLKLATQHAARQVVEHPAPVTLRAGVWSDLAALVASGQRFGAIYIDPPWQYDNQASRGAAENHYGTMAVEEIAALPVAALAAEQCHLHLWATEPFLEDAIGLVKGWGFERKSSLVWAKPQLGLGNYWRVSHEILLLGVKGSAPFRDKSVRSWLELPRGKHSEKPEEFRELLERVSPGPYLELFARRAVPGWTVWGNQIALDAQREAS